MQCVVSYENTFLSIKEISRHVARTTSGPAAFAYVETAPVNSIESSSEVSTPCSRTSEATSFASATTVSSKSQKTAKKTDLGRFSRKHEVTNDQKTTVMIRNIPCVYQEWQLLDDIKSTGIPCNFMYLAPSQTRPTGNLGYAFVNFRTAQDAQDFMAAFNNCGFKHAPKSYKKSILQWATLQGFKANVKFYCYTKTAKANRRPKFAATEQGCLW